MFTKLYLSTTDPKLSLSEMISQNTVPLVVSIIFHTILYMLFVNLASYIFFGKLLSMKINNRLFIVLIIIMTFGYIARFYHVKDIYQAYNNDIMKTRKHLDKLYIGWIFIA
jgi:uncharacterized membrane protein (DUF485 family)